MATETGDKKENFQDKLNEAALTLLYGVGLVFLISVIVIFISLTVKNCVSKQEIILKVDTVQIKKDSTFFYANTNIVDSLNEFNRNLDVKIDEIKRIDDEVKDLDGKNTDLFKLFLAIIGSIFAIVGFFGFKSIYETRENAIKAAVANAEKEAIRVATDTAKIEIAKISITVLEDISSIKENIRGILDRLDDIEEKNSNPPDDEIENNNQSELA